MKLKLPPIVSQLHNLPWSGAALDVETHQRLSMRWFAMVFLILTVSFLVSVGVYRLIPQTITGIVLVGATGLAGAAALIWLFYQSVKLYVLRMRKLGFTSILAFIGIYLGLHLVASGADWAQDYALVFVNRPFAHVLGLFTLAGSLYTYLLYFHSKPVYPNNVPTAQPLSPMGRTEAAALLVFQTFLWFQVFTPALNLVVPQY